MLRALLFNRATAAFLVLFGFLTVCGALRIYYLQELHPSEEAHSLLTEKPSVAPLSHTPLPESITIIPSWQEGGHFLRVARTFHKFIDKVTNHHYEFMYAKYLDGIRNKPLHLLEIGIGCDMVWGPGWSYLLWKQYLPNANFTYIDWDKRRNECVSRMGKKTSPLTQEDRKFLSQKTFWGNQEDISFLQKVTKAQKQPFFDIIVDDGAHTMEAQINSLLVLFTDALRPGGYYFLEDMQSSYHEMWGATKQLRSAGKTTVEAIKDLIGMRHNTQHGPNFLRETLRIPQLATVLPFIRSIDCDAEICVLTKAI